MFFKYNIIHLLLNYLKKKILKNYRIPKIILLYVHKIHFSCYL